MNSRVEGIPEGGPCGKLAIKRLNCQLGSLTLLLWLEVEVGVVSAAVKEDIAIGIAAGAGPLAFSIKIRFSPGRGQLEQSHH